MKLLYAALIGLVLPVAASAAVTDYRQFFRVDLSEPLPSISELKQ